MSAPINPVDVEEAIRRITNAIANGVQVVSEHLTHYREAERLYDLEYARAYMAYSGAAHAKRYYAEIHTTEHRADRDQQEVIFRTAERKMKALEVELTAWQTINKNVIAMYGAAGQHGG